MRRSIAVLAGVLGAALLLSACDISIGPGGQLDHHRVQVEPDQATHVGHTRVDQGRDSHLRMISVTAGSVSELAERLCHVRDLPDARLAAFGARARDLAASRFSPQRYTEAMAGVYAGLGVDWR